MKKGKLSVSIILKSILFSLLRNICVFGNITENMLVYIYTCISKEQWSTKFISYGTWGTEEMFVRNGDWGHRYFTSCDWSTQSSKKLHEKRSATHMFDVWHVAKGIQSIQCINKLSITLY